MEYEVTTIPPFDKEFKALKKKYPSITGDLKNLKDELKKNPKAGTEIADDIYKIRMAITAKGRGKSGGARVIYLNLFAQRTDNNQIVLLAIYDKSDRESITDKEIRQAIKEV